MNKLYEEYVTWLKKTHNITPEDRYCGISSIQEAVSLRDEILGKKGFTRFVRFMVKDGTWGKAKAQYKGERGILTFKEYKKAKKDKII